MFSKKGTAGEEQAARLLKDKKYKILHRNYAAKTGEIDIICSAGGTLVFVEVKDRATDAYGGGAAAVNKAKQQKIANTAAVYIKEKKPVFDSARFDVIVITGGKAEHIESAFFPPRMTI